MGSKEVVGGRAAKRWLGSGLAGTAESEGKEERLAGINGGLGVIFNFSFFKKI